MESKDETSMLNGMMVSGYMDTMSFIDSARREHAKTMYPLLANSRAKKWPIPEEHPVTNAVFLSVVDIM